MTPASFFTSADDLAAYTVNLYGVLTSIGPGSYGMSTFAYDNDTDNQAGTGYSSRWVPGNWKVGQSGGAWDFGNIRSVNYFLAVPVPKSTMRASSGKSKRNTVSTSTSVSGRGTKVSGVTIKSSVQNGCEPVT